MIETVLANPVVESGSLLRYVVGYDLDLISHVALMIRWASVNLLMPLLILCNLQYIS
jgi:hypothetical protein